MKILAETTGDFMLHDLSSGQTVQATRPSVITRTGFIDARIAINQVVKIADLPEDATDEDFVGFWTESGDRDLAIASFVSKSDPEAAAPKPQRKGK